MTRMKLVSTKISTDWVDRLEESTKLTGLTQSALVRKAIGQYLGLETVDSVGRVDPLRSEIEAIKARLSTLERLTQLTMVDPLPIAAAKTSTPKSSTPKPIAAKTSPPIARICQHCGSSDVINSGFGRLRNDGTRGQRVLCLSCKRSQTV